MKCLIAPAVSCRRKRIRPSSFIAPLCAGVQCQGLLLMLTRLGQPTARQAHLAGQEVHVGLVRGQRAG